MELFNEPTSPALGMDLPPWRIRVIARSPFVEGQAVQLDTPLVNGDSDNMRIADSGSGLVNATFVQSSAARSGRIIGIGTATVADNQKGYVTIRGITNMWVSGTGSAGDGISVGTLESGNRIVAIALEAWTTTAFIRVLFDGAAGFGTYLAAAAADSPVVNITSPADGAEFELGDSITFTATATDATDGDVSASLDWVSSLDGTIATNDASFAKSDLTVGIHTITATAQDSDGPPNEGSDSIIIEIVNPGGGHDHDPPSDGGGGSGQSVVV